MVNMHQVDMMLEKLLLWVALLVIIIIIINIIMFPSSLLHMQNAFLQGAAVKDFQSRRSISLILLFPHACYSWTLVLASKCLRE